MALTIGLFLVAESFKENLPVVSCRMTESSQVKFRCVKGWCKRVIGQFCTSPVRPLLLHRAFAGCQPTIFEGVRLARPAVFDYEWDTIVKLKTDLLGRTILEAGHGQF